jgi:hypothetical protein
VSPGSPFGPSVLLRARRASDEIDGKGSGMVPIVEARAVRKVYRNGAAREVVQPQLVDRDQSHTTSHERNRT